VAKHDDDMADMRIIVEALNFFAPFTFEQYIQHIKEHPEDKWYDLTEKRGHHRLLGREGARAFQRLARRQRDLAKNAIAIDEGALEDAIREMFVELFIRDRRPVNERKWVDRMLSRALKRSSAKHAARTHYYPCIFVFRADPPEFRVVRCGS
jgi:hypothetical protein